MSTQQQRDKFEQSQNIPNVSAKTIVLNVFDLAGEDINRKQTWEALKEAEVIDTGYEYFRRTFKETVDGEHDVDAAVDDQIKSVLESVLSQAGLLKKNVSTSEAEEDSSETLQTPPAQQSQLSTDTSQSTAVPVSDLQELHDRIDLLRRQAEYEAEGSTSPEYRKAQFIADEALVGLEELIKSASQD